MPLTDYSDLLDRMQRNLAARFQETGTVLNVPGVSVACKIDQNYYLAVEPLLASRLGSWCGVVPEKVTETLVKTGNMLSANTPEGRTHTLDLAVTWPGRGGEITIKSAFILADFIERALELYSGAWSPLTLSDLRIVGREKEKVEEFFKGKTVPAKWVYEE